MCDGHARQLACEQEPAGLRTFGCNAQRDAYVDERQGHGARDWRYAPWILEARTHRKLAWDKAAVFARTAKLCGKCYGFPDSAFRACQQCFSSCCTSCLPQDRLCCSQCPAVDLVAFGQVVVQRCYKCERNQPCQTQQCQDCLLWLCIGCFDDRRKRCYRNCSKGARSSVDDGECPYPYYQSHCTQVVF